jgi:hypothetical protein
VEEAVAFLRCRHSEDSGGSITIVE